MRQNGKPAPKGRLLALMLVGAGLIVLGVASFLLLPKPGANASQPEPPAYAIPVAVDFPAPELNLYDLQKQPVAFSDYAGQVILVNNWATWCPPCKAEMPTLEAYYQDHLAQGFVIVAIESGEPSEEVAEFVRQHDLSFPVWPDPGVRALATFKNDALPSTYVIDRQGQVRLAWVGPISRELLEKYVTPMIKE